MSQDLLVKNPRISGLPFDQVDGAIAALMSGQVEAVIGSMGVELERRKNSNLGFKIAAQIIESKADTVIAVRKDWPELVALVNKALGDLSEAQQLALSRRWYGDFKMDAAARINLTDGEKSWLAQGQTVRVRIRDWPPYMFTKPIPSGIAVDYLDLIARHLGFRVEYISDTSSWTAAMEDVRGIRQKTGRCASSAPKRGAIWRNRSTPSVSPKRQRAPPKWPKMLPWPPTVPRAPSSPI